MEEKNFINDNQKNGLNRVCLKIVDRSRGFQNHIHVETRCSDLATGISLYPNVRENKASTKNSISKGILETVNKFPELFHGSNNGLKISCRYYKTFIKDGEEFIEMYLDKFDGVFNGGHTYNLLNDANFRSQIEDISNLENSIISINVESSFPSEAVYFMAVGSNTQKLVNAVQTWSMIKGRSVADWMKTSFTNGSAITAKQKASGNSMDNMVKLTANWLPSNFTTNDATHEIVALIGKNQSGVGRISISNLGKKLTDASFILEKNTPFYKKLCDMTSILDSELAHSGKFAKTLRFIIGSFEKTHAISIQGIIAMTFVFAPLVRSWGNDTIEWVDNAEELLIAHKAELVEAIDDYLTDLDFGRKGANNNGREIDLVEFDKLKEIGENVFFGADSANNAQPTGMVYQGNQVYHEDANANEKAKYSN